jgi:hypothetical protein
LSYRLLALPNNLPRSGGITHNIEVTADSICQAIAQRLRALRVQVLNGPMMLDRVRDDYPRHQAARRRASVRVNDIEAWLESTGRTSVKMSLKMKLRQLFGK